MIIIKKPNVYEQNGETYLSSEIIVPKETNNKWISKVAILGGVKGSGIEAYPKLYKYQSTPFKLWYAVEMKYAQYLCYDRGDAFLVALLYFAMLTGEDITSEAVITEKLLYQLQYYIIPMLCNESTGYKEIRIFAPSTSEPHPTKGAVATGISCGIDSLSSVFLHLQEDTPLKNRLTHLTLFNTGALNYFPSYLKGKSLDDWNDEAFQEFDLKRKEGRAIAEELGLNFVSVNSNLSDLYQGMFLLSHTYRNCSAALILQGLWGCYYYSSAGLSRDHFKPSLHNDTASYDILILQCLSTYSMDFYSSGMPYTRLDKTRFLIDNNIAHKYLNVCEKNKNCGKCSKCKRTMTTLFMLERLKDFSNVFDNISEFEFKKWRVYCGVLDSRRYDEFSCQIYDYLVRNEVAFPIKSKMYHFLFPLRQLIVKFLKLLGIFHG